MKVDTQKGLSRRDVGRNTLRRTLRRRVSMSLMRQKMRKLQDYSLPCQTDNFRFLHVVSDFCNSPLLGLCKGMTEKVSKITQKYISTKLFIGGSPLRYSSNQQHAKIVKTVTVRTYVYMCFFIL